MSGHRDVRFRFRRTERGVILRRRQAFDAYIAEHFDLDEEGDLIAKHVGKRPSDESRGYYHAVVVPIAAEWMGEPCEDDAHDALAWKFLRIEDCPKTGRPRRKSTSPDAMSDDEWKDYLTRVVAWLTVDCGCRVPEPERDPARRGPVRSRERVSA